MVKNLEFAYGESVRKSESAETSARINIDMWLSPLEKEIDDKNVVVCVVFFSLDKPEIFLSGADADLYSRFINRMKTFVV